MELSNPELAFIEAELESIMDDPSRDGEDRMFASSILGKVQGDVEFEKDQHKVRA
jgi:hypothetical protein